MRKALVLICISLLALSLSVSSAHSKKRKKKKPVVHSASVTGTWPMQYKWVPESITVKAGEYVAWDLAGAHNVTPYDGPWETGAIETADASGREMYRFDEPGEYFYHCSFPLHSLLIEPVCLGQCGSITVEQ